MRIGLIVNILNEEYQISVFKGIRKRTEELGIELLCLQDENFNFEQTLLTESKSTKSFFGLDGIILLTSVLSDSTGVNNLSDIKKLWGDIPVVSVGQKIEGIPSLLVQTDNSMRSLVEHLIIEHKYRKFIYLSGPQTHYDARKRENIFKKTMDEYKSQFPQMEYIIKRGHFYERAAIEEMKECYKEYPDFNPDVVVCANDGMAIGVYKFFQINRDNPAIKECAVTGFDDIPKGRYVIPALTTIHQPLEEIGNAAVNTILKRINNEKNIEDISIESSIVYRNSCGCKNFQDISEFASKIQTEYINSEELLTQVRLAGHDLSYGENKESLKQIINETAEQLNVSNFCVLRFPEHSKKDFIGGIGDVVAEQVYVRRNGQYLPDFRKDKVDTLESIYENYIKYDSNSPKTLVFKFLNSGNEIIGCIFYDSREKLLQYLVTIAIDIAQALARIESMEERRKRSEYLEKEVTKRTQELIESNNMRMKVEAEVLKISELERQRFSTDLHDDICQRLAGISMLCRSYSNLDKGVQKSQMDELADLISETLFITRQYAHNSYPVELESLGMDHSLSNLCNSFEKQSGIKCIYEWKLKDDSGFDKMQKLNIFRIVQEALHNAMKHSKAQIVTVIVKKTGKSVTVTIADDGCGFNISELDSNGIGLNSMQYRANQIGASFRIFQNVPHGTCVEVRVTEDEK